jgi:hypothetical protein
LDKPDRLCSTNISDFVGLAPDLEKNGELVIRGSCQKFYSYIRDKIPDTEYGSRRLVKENALGLGTVWPPWSGAPGAPDVKPAPYFPDLYKDPQERSRSDPEADQDVQTTRNPSRLGTLNQIWLFLIQSN